MTEPAAAIPFKPLRHQNPALAVIAVIAAALVAGAWKYTLVFGIFLTALALASIVAYLIFRRNSNQIVVGWVALAPLGYYFLSYPREAPLISFDRVVVGVLFLAAFLGKRSEVTPISSDMRAVAFAWALFIAVITLPVMLGDVSNGWMGQLRFVVDVTLLPGLLGWYILRQFHVYRHAKSLHIALCVASIYSACIGVGEILTQRDLLKFEAAYIPMANMEPDASSFIWLRANGPYATNNSYAIIGLITFVLLAFLWALIREEAGPVQRTLHVIASSAAILQALLPLFRSIVITLVLIAAVDCFFTVGIRRIIRGAAVASVFLAVACSAAFFPELFSSRTSSDNVNSRVAQNEQTLEIFLDNPLTGVGLGNYEKAATSGRYNTSYHGVEGVNFPHSNIGWVLSEMGIFGFVPFLASQVLLFGAFVRLRKNSDAGALVWKYFLFTFLAYWFSGLTLTVAYFADLNIWFIFAIAVLYGYGTAKPEGISFPALMSEA